MYLGPVGEPYNLRIGIPWRGGICVVITMQILRYIKLLVSSKTNRCSGPKMSLCLTQYMRWDDEIRRGKREG